MIRPAKKARIGSFLLPVLALAAVLALSGCGGGEEDSSTATTGATAETAEADRNSNEEGNGEADGQDGQGSQADGGSDSNQGSNTPQPQGEEEPGITQQQRNEATPADITLGSTFQAGAALPAKYTCDGKNTWPAFRWKGLPSDAEELVLMVLSVHPVRKELLFDWAVAGLDPSLTEIEEGKLPSGAIVGENSFGKDAYNICPDAGTAESYVFMLFAIPEALDPSPGFDARTLRGEVLAQSGNVGLLAASYKR